MATKPNTRDNILQIGRILLSQHGYQGLHYSAIAKKLKVKNAAIHYYFPRKQDLVEEIIRMDTQKFRALYEKYHTLPSHEQLDKFFEYVEQEIFDGYAGQFANIIFTSKTLLPPKIANTFFENMHFRFSWLVEIIQKGQAEGVFTIKEEIQILVGQIHTMIIGITSIVMISKAEFSRKHMTSVIGDFDYIYNPLVLKTIFKNIKQTIEINLEHS